MPILKCKMCGGDIVLSPDKTFGICDSCGSTMTFPKVDDDQRAALFNRGNQFRRAGEFDRALAIYERLVEENEQDAEAHWCCALCRFGIEYVEDPTTFEYIPTCHRASFESFLEDVDYLAAVENSDGITRRQYQKDAAKIAEIQRGILATSQNEEPFDVFICYKETGSDGARTRDSLFAQDIYYQLTGQGYRVFYARITLEDKAGTEYEPYIFAALNSAKVMVVVTTSAENVNAVWVKNEWSRFLALMRKDKSKLLIPCYRDMDPYDFPEALSVLQSYDMSKIGFIQDLIRGIKKVLGASGPKEVNSETTATGSVATNVTAGSLLRRAFMFLEDGDWEKADDFCEQVLNMDPENAEAYLGKLMALLKVRQKEDLEKQEKPFGRNRNYQKAIKFSDESLRAELSKYADAAHQRFLNNAIAEAKAKLDKSITKAAIDKAVKEMDYGEDIPQINQMIRDAQKDYEERALAAIDLWSKYSSKKKETEELQKKIQRGGSENYQKYNELRRQLTNINQIKDRLSYHISKLDSLQNSIANLENSISREKEALSKLGAFAFGAKKEKNALLLDLNAQKEVKLGEAKKIQKNIDEINEELKQTIAEDELRPQLRTAEELVEQETQSLQAELREEETKLSIIRDQLINPGYLAVLLSTMDEELYTDVMKDQSIYPCIRGDERLFSIAEENGHYHPSLAPKDCRGDKLDKSALYYQACQALEHPSSNADILWAKDVFISLSGYKDSDQKRTECNKIIAGA